MEKVKRALLPTRMKARKRQKKSYGEQFDSEEITLKKSPVIGVSKEAFGKM
jgi:hypothetical protein